jgi:hypothetical protein
MTSEFLNPTGEAVIAHGRRLDLGGPLSPLTCRSGRSGSIVGRATAALRGQADGDEGLRPRTVAFKRATRSVSRPAVYLVNSRLPGRLLAGAVRC